MPSGDQIQTYLTGAWRMMTGRPDGLRMLDISADGFWNSFFAIVVALPAMLVGWVPLASEIGGPYADSASRFGLVLRFAVVDLCAWIAPIAVLGLVARYAGIQDRFVHYVVASNWGGALLVWMVLPASLAGLVWPEAEDAVAVLTLLLFVVTMALSWRLTNAAIDRGPAIATAVLLGVVAVSLLVLFALQPLLGIAPVQG